MAFLLKKCVPDEIVPLHFPKSERKNRINELLEQSHSKSLALDITK